MSNLGWSSSMMTCCSCPKTDMLEMDLPVRAKEFFHNVHAILYHLPDNPSKSNPPCKQNNDWMKMHPIGFPDILH